MIGFIRGKVIYADGGSVIIDNNGVGYKVECCNLSVLEGQETEIFISTYMRENELKLFGFKTQLDLKIFELLLEVNGVGPKAGLMLVGNLGSKKIISAINQNKSEYLKVKGIGQKTAQKIVLELNNKIKLNNLILQHVGDEDQMEMQPYDERAVDAKEALINFGFVEREIDDLINQLDLEQDKDIKTEDIIKTLLKQLRK